MIGIEEFLRAIGNLLLDLPLAAYHLIDTHGARAAAVAEQRARTAGTETGALTWMRIARALRDIQDSAATAHRPAE